MWILFKPSLFCLSLKRGGASCLMLLLLFSSYFGFAQPLPLYAYVSDNVRAESFILMDADTGQILLERDMHSQRKPASITKIMTTLLALELCGPDDLVTVSATAVAANPGDGSSAGLMPGEIIPLNEILRAVMLESANEAANAVAEHVSGSMEDFALLMTERAAQLGAKNTNFINANGLNADEHYTSAYDMALITREAVKQKGFNEVWGAYQYFIEPTNLQADRRIVNNKNRMLPQGSLPYEGILGGKTGYTNASQNTLVEAASRQGRTLICVLLTGPGALANFQDATNLLDYGFGAFYAYEYENEDYESTYTFLVHDDIKSDQLVIDYGEPSENEDGSRSVTLSVAVPAEYGVLMYTDIASATLTSTVPEPTPPAFPDLRDLGVPGSARQGTAEIGRTRSPLVLFVSLIDRLPSPLAFIVKVILSIFISLFTLAVVFRTRRWLRRRERRLMKQRMEARKRIYREQHSFWS